MSSCDFALDYAITLFNKPELDLLYHLDSMQTNFEIDDSTILLIHSDDFVKQPNLISVSSIKPFDFC